MSDIWHFGNTTVRNPARISQGLRVLYNSECHGNLIGVEKEKRFAEQLAEHGVIEIKEGTEDYSSSGRKWRACFHQLGLITFKPVNQEQKDLINNIKNHEIFADFSIDEPFSITPNGLRFISSDNYNVQQDAMLRSLISYELKSVIEKNYNFSGFKPFIFIVLVLDRLLRVSNKGLSKTEMAILTRYNSFDHVETATNTILMYRKEREQCQINKKKFDLEFIKNLFPEFENGSFINTIISDYPDLNMRYVRFTGLFNTLGNRIVFNEDRKEQIDVLLNDPQYQLPAANNESYLINLWCGSSLATDTVQVNLNYVLRLCRQMNYAFNTIELNNYTNDQLNVFRHEIEEQYSKHREIQYAEQQKNEIEEIINYLKKIENRNLDVEILTIPDYPAYLEWAVWRAFLAINSLVNKPYEARRFKVDHEFYPLGCAPGGGPDLIFEFEDYVLVVELTLTTSSRQEAAEGESVRRHVAKIQEQYQDKAVYGLFIAKEIDNNTAEVFRIGIWYSRDEANFINIVPITLSDFIEILKNFNSRQLNKDNIRRILEKCLIPRNAHAPVWKAEIKNEISKLNELWWC